MTAKDATHRCESDRPHGLCPDCIAERTATECATQGVPLTATPAQVARLAALGTQAAA